LSKDNNILCPFCNENILNSCFYETKNFRALYNVAPVLPGHTLVIPRWHVTSLLLLSKDELTDFIEVSRKITGFLLKVFQTDAYDWSVQEKPEAGQSIEHLHMHIVPRTKDDLPVSGGWYPLVQKNDKEIIDSIHRERLKPDEMKSIIDHLKSELHKYRI